MWLPLTPLQSVMRHENVRARMISSSQLVPEWLGSGWIRSVPLVGWAGVRSLGNPQGHRPGKSRSQGQLAQVCKRHAAMHGPHGFNVLDTVRSHIVDAPSGHGSRHSCAGYVAFG